MATSHTRWKARRSTSTSKEIEEVEEALKRSLDEHEEETVPDSEGDGSTTDEEGEEDRQAKTKRRSKNSLSSDGKIPNKKTRIVIEDSDTSEAGESSEKDESEFSEGSSSEETEDENTDEDEDLSDEEMVATNTSKKNRDTRQNKVVQTKGQVTKAASCPPSKKPSVGQVGKATAATRKTTTPTRRTTPTHTPKESQKTKTQPKAPAPSGKHTLHSQSPFAPETTARTQSPTNAPSPSTIPLWKRRMVPGLVRSKVSVAGKPLCAPASQKRVVPGLSAPKLG